MKVRTIALNNFSEKKIPAGAPMATLEEVLVPVYLFHRYQIDAAAKVIGGLYYNHTLRGGVQSLPKIVPAGEQLKALDALLETIKPKNLLIDDKILNLIPPRAPGYGQTRELFSDYTGPTFDYLAAAENVANMTVSNILNAQRAARLVDYHARDNKYPGLADVIDQLISSTWKTEADGEREAEIQRVVNYVVLKNLMQLAANKNAAPQVCAITFLKLTELQNWLAMQKMETKNIEQKAHYSYAYFLIEQFQKNPEGFEMPSTLSTPPGAPIGMYD
jgi:hypothetical protein